MSACVEHDGEVSDISEMSSKLIEPTLCALLPPPWADSG